MLCSQHGDRMLIRPFCALRAESPNSLIERGHYEQARTVLRRTRGTPDVELEFEDIYQASQAVRKPCSRLLGIMGVLRSGHRTSVDVHRPHAARCGWTVAAMLTRSSQCMPHAAST